MKSTSKCPCEECQSKPCDDYKCQLWKPWFAKRWNAETGKIRDYLWKLRDDLGKQRNPRFFYYVLPHEQSNPCDKCICAAWCKTPCSLRLHWWDVTMAKIRKTLSKKE